VREAARARYRERSSGSFRYQTSRGSAAAVISNCTGRLSSLHDCRSIQGLRARAYSSKRVCQTQSAEFAIVARLKVHVGPGLPEPRGPGIRLQFEPLLADPTLTETISRSFKTQRRDSTDEISLKVI